MSKIRFVPHIKLDPAEQVLVTALSGERFQIHSHGIGSNEFYLDMTADQFRHLLEVGQDELEAWEAEQQAALEAQEEVSRA